ncbi:Ff.00g099590.m01.CDS01 [Fusarium sp. VM40]|nr:Ff.00g099590.m01.CDS01 [Fusarium sp. VM40]
MPPYGSCDEANGTKKLKFLQPTPTDGYSALQNGSAFPQHKQHSQYNMIKEITLAPYKYIERLPSKGVRNILIDALNIWFKVPETSSDIIREVTTLLHSSSLMFDDIEDGSALRRGKPTAHKIFGVAQTINSSTYVLMSSIAKARLLSNNVCIDILIDGVRLMLEGQAADLHSTYLAECPQEHEYLQMVDRKTGGLFRIIYQLMRAESLEPELPCLDTAMILWGRYFQIRDDFMNLTSEEYTGQKGFCEDLDEGKFSFPLIHCLGGTGHLAPDTPRAIEMKSILASRSHLYGGGIPSEIKCHMLDIMGSAGSLDFTKLALERLERDLRAETELLERVAGCNPILRGLIDKMKI